MRLNFAGRIRGLEIIAARIRRNVLEICRRRGGCAAQGVALADIAACLYFDELRPDGKGWFHDRLVLSNGQDAVMTFGALAKHGSYTMDELKSYNADGTRIDQRAQLKDSRGLRSPPARWARGRVRPPEWPGPSADEVQTYVFTACFPTADYSRAMFGRPPCSPGIRTGPSHA